MATREIYKVDQTTGKSTYAGYATFDSSGKYTGSHGGYGSRSNPKNATSGRGTADMGRNPWNGGYRFQGNSSNGGSLMQNTIKNSGSRQSALRQNATAANASGRKRAYAPRGRNRRRTQSGGRTRRNR